LSATDPLITEFQQAIANQASEFEVALLVSKVIDPQLDLGALRTRFDDMLAPLAQTPEMDAGAFVHRFADLGFGQSALTNATANHSNIAWVLDHQLGLPIAVAAILMEGARRCGLHSEGINFPGHFLVAIDARLVDPLTMEFLSPAQLQSEQLDAQAVQKLLQPATPMVLGLRMLNNLKMQYLQSADGQNWMQVLTLIDYQAAMASEDEALLATFHFERAELWERLGAFSLARDEFLQCVQISPLTQLRNKAQARADQLAGQTETLH
jgi:regulator of sirC expression with transglutaminase-like and TPR domain